MSWMFQNQEVAEITDPKVVGFVYLITNNTNGRMYIGKKLAKKSKTKIVKGKKKKTTVDSDWKTYFGSNKELLDDVKLLGEENFRREILHWCYSKSEATYVEAYEQFTRKVLETNDYYNHWIMCRITKKNLKRA